jgi:hypothetical protein
VSSDLLLFLGVFVRSLDIKSYRARELLCELHVADRSELTVSQDIRAYASTHIDQAAQLSYEIGSVSTTFSPAYLYNSGAQKSRTVSGLALDTSGESLVSTLDPDPDSRTYEASDRKPSAIATHAHRKCLAAFSIRARVLWL